MKNISIITEFVLLGLPSDPQIQTVLYVLFLGIYLLTLVGNTVMILIIKADARLHTPMYFFLGHLSFLDLSFSSSHCAQNATELLVSEEKHLSVGLHHSEFLFHSLRGDRSLSSLRHGLRPLCCYMPPSALHCGHKQTSLHWDCEHSLGSGIFYFFNE